LIGATPPSHFEPGRPIIHSEARMMRCYIHEAERFGDAFALCSLSYCQGSAR
jgi:hypothetical protein